MIDVCDSTARWCLQCEQTTAVRIGEWAIVQCREPLKGALVKIMTPLNYFQACEVEVYGTSKLIFMKVKFMHVI